MPCSLYIYTRKNGQESYIGISKDIDARIKQHSSCKSGARRFNNAVRKHGIGAFDFKILAILEECDAARTEQAAILAFKTLSPNGLNLVAGSPCSEYHGAHSEETKLKIGAANSGKKRSSAWCKRQSEERKGEKRPPRSAEWRKKRSDIMMGNTRAEGVVRSTETRSKSSLSHIGQIPWNKGIPRSAETKQKISDTIRMKRNEQS